MLWLAAWRIRDEEMPRIAILTAAFFVSSLIHIRVGPTSIHLLLTGLVGVLLGRRAALAIAVGLLLQMLLIGHGGWSTLGVNTCVMTFPPCSAGCSFRRCTACPGSRRRSARGVLVGGSAIVLFLSAVYSVTLLCNTPLDRFDRARWQIANERLLDPWIIGGALLFAVAAIALESRLENTPEFPLGFLIGELAVLLTVGPELRHADCWGARTNGRSTPLLLVIAHLPFAVVEGLILGFVVGFLARVKPEMLGIGRIGCRGLKGEPRRATQRRCTLCQPALAFGSRLNVGFLLGKISSNATSHWPKPKLTTQTPRFASTRTTRPCLSYFGTQTVSPACSFAAPFAQIGRVALLAFQFGEACGRIPRAAAGRRAAPPSRRPAPSPLPRVFAEAGATPGHGVAGASDSGASRFSRSRGNFKRRAIFRALLMPNWPISKR